MTRREWRIWANDWNRRVDEWFDFYEKCRQRDRDRFDSVRLRQPRR